MKASSEKPTGEAVHTLPEVPDDESLLIPLARYRESGRAPIEMHHAIFHHRRSLEQAGAVVKYGSKWLVSERHLMRWLREHGRGAGRPKRPNEAA